MYRLFMRLKKCGADWLRGRKMKSKKYSPLPTPTAGLEQTQLAAEGRLRESLGKNLGSGYEESTPGQQALAQLAQKSSELKQGVQTGEMTEEEAQMQAHEESSRIPTASVSSLPVRHSIPRMGLAEMAQLRKKNIGGRFKISPYGIDQIG